MNDSLEGLKITTSTPSQSRRLWMAIVLGTLAAFGPLSIDMYLPALPNIAKDLHTTPSLVQFSLTFFLLGLSLGQLLAGPLSDVRGRRKPLLIGLIIFFVASLLCAFSQSIWGLIILRFIQGMAGSAGIVISRAIVRDLYSGSELTKFFSLLALVNGVAPVLAPIVGAQLLRIAPWQGVFMVLSVIGLIMFFIVLFGLPETLPNDSRSLGGIKNTLTTFQKLFFDRSFIGYALSQGLVFAAMFAYISGSPFVLQSIYGASPQMFSLIFAINGIGIIISSQITGRLAGRISERKLFVVGLCIAFIGAITLLIMLLLNTGLYAILTALFFVVSSVGVVSTTGFSLAMQNQGKSAGSASALLGVLSLVFGGSVAPLVGLGSNPAISMGIVIAIASVSSILSYIFLVARPYKYH
ncbi:multidrug effflux MFS transporter [Peribacillus loiseleuriae]|uniref:multidrug effflux MFS transporter n=1 Tax=Peribacillus loiseleuriae TaxID=1679170 RepID=UPI003D06DA06